MVGGSEYDRDSQMPIEEFNSNYLKTVIKWRKSRFARNTP